MSDGLRLADFPCVARDKVRYGDTDRQGHVNNAVFSTFLETGRAEFLLSADRPMAHSGFAFVIARLVLDFRGEILWPGEVAIGTRVETVGRSSVTLAQAVFQEERCVAVAQTVIVQMDEATRKSRPLSPATADRLASLQ